MRIYIILIFLSIFICGVSVQENQQLKMSDFIGINSKVAYNLPARLFMARPQQIHPNPADGVAQISINNPKFHHAKISVYSADGKLVEVISDKGIDAGQQNFSFGKSFSPGLYFISLNTSEFRKVEKVIIRSNSALN